MKFENRVAWSEGMFLRVQHFQQADRWTERLVRITGEMLSPYPWGVAEINIDRSALAIGQFALSSVRGILPDGTPFEAPDDTDLPPPLKLEEQAHNAIVYLALPVRQPGKAEFTIDGNETAKVRFVASHYDAPDANIDTDFLAPIDVGRANFRLLKSGDELAGYALIGIARIIEVRSDKAVVLDGDYIAPSLNCAAEPRLKELLTELLGIVRHRAEAIATRIGDPTVRGTAEIGDYFLLHILNRAEPLLSHIAANATRIHPITFYEHCIQLAGELSTFTTERKRAAEFPPYRHDDLKATFAAVFDDLRTSLSVVLEQSAVPIELAERRHGVRVGMINDRSLLKDAGFVLAVRAEMPAEEIRRKLPAQIKVGPVERIAELVNVALPGIPVRPLPVLPRQLPYRAGTVYFELDTQNPIWHQLGTSGAIALHLAGEFPNIEMELWALRE
jgi:type VI secretion system protein ImpJ